ncbi:hypothetical protein GWR56_18180 [Mucilaginibacter sp. 14171R-50]|uniref:hypothetical protein n=1 Tax=Mucilaginibacter sp. 14171R-50 TaxID=2703789 RepID=UPI00138B355D|nr:hypothetical protein [Mucilaginibacter sp. 14171R-50]QHS57373.1 hypothetical protein GWR56_18180 [Mucilaginibacter sp. 14171R-50]
MLQPALPVLNAFFLDCLLRSNPSKKAKPSFPPYTRPAHSDRKPPALKCLTKRNVIASVAWQSSIEKPLKRKSTVLTSPPNAALACSSSIAIAKALPFTEQDAAATFLFGTFSFERKEKVHPLTTWCNTAIPNEEEINCCAFMNVALLIAAEGYLFFAVVCFFKVLKRASPFCLETKEAKIQVSKKASLPHKAFTPQTGQNHGLEAFAPRFAAHPSLQQNFLMPLPRTTHHCSARFRPKLLC